MPFDEMDILPLSANEKWKERESRIVLQISD